MNQSPVDTPTVASAAPASSQTLGDTLSLVRSLRATQRSALARQGQAWAGALLIASLIGAIFIAPASRALSLGLAALGTLTSIALWLLLARWLPARRVGDDEATARLLAKLAPDLRLDALAAVELEHRWESEHGHSPTLAKAFVREVDVRARRYRPQDLLDPRPVRIAMAGFSITIALCLYFVLVFTERFIQGLSTLAAPSAPKTLVARSPITGDFTLTYRYPAYTGLEERTLTGTTGEISAPAGTEVMVQTRADRDVEGAALVVNGTNVALTVKARTLEGRFILDQPGQYHVAFLDGQDVSAEGPDVPIHIEADSPPSVELLSPEPELELDPDKRDVPLRYAIADDYGLTQVELVYRAPGKPEQRQKLTVDDGRTVRGTTSWNLAALALKPGEEVAYYLEATDNDAVHGPKRGVSRTQTLKLYSAAAHQREALEKAEALWERLVLHLADRLESPERKAPVEANSAGAAIDARARTLAEEMRAFATEQLKARDPLPDVPEAMGVAGKTLADDTRSLGIRRRDGARLMTLVELDTKHSEASVLYLEQLLDRRKLDALEQLAKELREDRRELARLIDEFKKSPDDKTQQALLQQMQQLRQRMQALQQQMAELAKGIRDEFVNTEGLQEALEEKNLQSALDELEQLVREGKAEEAAKRMQELAMEMDQMLEQLEAASERSDDEADPELERMVEDFEKSLDETMRSQEQLAQQTQALRDKARAAAKSRLEKEGPQLKKEALKSLAELERSLMDAADEHGPFSIYDEAAERALGNARSAKQALEADEFDLASEAAERLKDDAEQLRENAEQRQQQGELFQMPNATKRDLRRRAEQAKRNEHKAESVAESLQRLFPQQGEGLSEGEQKSMSELAQRQQQLSQKAQGLRGQMQNINERAPLFDESSKEKAEMAQDRMQKAGQRLQGKDPNAGLGQQRGAMDAMQQLKQALQQQSQQAQGGSGKRGLPRPFAQRGEGAGRGNTNQKIAIPDEDPNRAARDLRQDVMNAMKQGAPDRYRDQNKHYYEELVK